MNNPTDRLEKIDILTLAVDKLTKAVVDGQDESRKNHDQTKAAVRKLTDEVHDHNARLEKLERETGRLRDTGTHHQVEIDRMKGSGQMRKVQAGESKHEVDQTVLAMTKYVEGIGRDNAAQTDSIRKVEDSVVEQGKDLAAVKLGLATVVGQTRQAMTAAKFFQDIKSDKKIVALACAALAAGSFAFEAAKHFFHW